jgi:hypothetical protein
MSDTRTDDIVDGGPVLDEAARLLRYREGDLHAEPLDELAARRLIDAAIARADAEGGAAAGAMDRRSFPPGRRALLVVAAAAAIAAAVSAVIFLRAPAGSGRGATIAARPAAPASVLLAAGAPTRDGTPAAVGDAVRPGDLLTADGELVIGIGAEIAVLAESGSELRLSRADGAAIEVSLVRGAVLASVTPGRRGAPFSVATAEGRVVVTGTVFRVLADEFHASAEVYRGVVSLDEGRGADRRLREGWSATLGAPGAVEIPQARMRAGLETAFAMDDLAAVDAARVSIASSPAGAAVALDGRRIGSTPLAFRARPGRRVLEVSAEGHSIVREVIDLRAGQPTTRLFDLAPDAVEAPAPGDSLEATTAGSTKTAAELLDEAQRRRAAKRWPEAVAAYESLVSTHGGSPEARVALVALGAIELDHLDRPSHALSQFERYLAAQPGGSLAPEAAWGGARALRRLGRAGEEEAMLRRIVASYPGSLQADSARARLAELREGAN